MEFKDYLGILKRQIVIILLITVAVFAAWYGLVHVRQPDEYTARAKVFSPNFAADFRIFSQFTGNNNLSPYISQASRMYLAYTEGVTKLTLSLLQTWDNLSDEDPFVRNAKAQEYVKQYKDKTIDDVKDHYHVDPIDNTPQMFIISARSDDPKFAQSLANLVGYSLCLHVKAIYTNGLNNAIKVMEEKCRGLLDALNEEEKKLRDIGFDPANTFIIDQFNRFNDKHLSLKTDIDKLDGEAKGIARRIAEIEQRIERIKAGDEKIEIILPPTPTFLELVAKIASLENQMFELRLYYKDEHPRIQDADNKINYYKLRLIEEQKQMQNGLTLEAVEKKKTQMIEQIDLTRIARKEELASKEEEKRSLQRSLEDLAKLIDGQKPDVDSHWKRKSLHDDQQKNVEKARAVLAKNETYLEQLQHERELLPEMLRVEEPARDFMKEERSSAKQFPIMILLSLIIGVSAGYMRDYLDDRVRTPYDLRRYMNIPTIGVVPETASGDSLIMESALKSPISECYAHIAAVLNTMVQQEQARVFLITSTTAREGKTTISSNTATAFARMGKRCCIVDCDMRRPSIHKVFHVDNTVGVSSFLSGKIDAKVHLNHIEQQPIVIPDPGASPAETPAPVEISAPVDVRNPLDEVLVETDIDNLWVIPCGPSPVNPVSLLESAAMREMLRLLKERFDVVIIDSPPIDSTADPLILSSSTDKTVLVISCWATRKYQLAWCKRMIGNVNANVAGAILNRSTVISKGYYYYYYDTSSSFTERV